MAVGISQEAADFPALVVRRGKESPASPRQCIRGCTAVNDSERDGVTDLIQISGRPEGDRKLVGRRTASAHQQQPSAGQLERDAGAAVLAVQLGGRDVYPDSHETARGYQPPRCV